MNHSVIRHCRAAATSFVIAAAALAAAPRAAAAEPATTARDAGWGVDDRSPAPRGGVTATALPPSLRGARRVEVPRELLGRPVTALAPGLFADCADLESVALPPGLAAVPDDCFRGCRRLREIALPEAAETVGERAFEGCASLRRVALPAGVRSLGRRALADCANLREADLGRCASVGGEALAGCARLGRVRFPEAPGATLGERALAGCRSLREARPGAGTAAVGAEAFAGCAALATVELPSTLEEIGERAFEGCVALRFASMPAAPGGAARPLRVGAGAFAGCTALEAASFGAAGALDLGDEAFRGCTALREARFGAASGRFGAAAFRGCRSLRAAAVPPGVTELPEDCFADCSALASLRLPPTLVAVGARALRGCTALRRLELPSSSVRFARDALAGCESLLVAWPSEDPATAAGVPARDLAAFGMAADGAPPARSARTSAGAAPAPRAAVASERAGSAVWSWRPAPEGDGAEIVGVAPAFSAGFFRGFPEGAVEWLLEQGDVAVPERLGGMPVAAIGPDAFRNLRPGRLDMPASVRRVGARAIPAGLQKLVFRGPPPRFDPDWVDRGPDDPPFDPFDFLEHPEESAREWAVALAPALPSARPDAAAAPDGTFVGEETVGGVRWTYSVRDGRARAGAGPGRPAVPPGTAGALEIPERLGGFPVEGLAPCAFLGMDRIGSVRVGGTRADFEIGDQAFRGCTALTNLSWDAACDVASIGAEALRDCTALERFDARGVRRFGAAAFAGCTALRSLRVGAAAGSPGPDALPPLFAAGCTALEEAELPVAAIGRGAFRGCTSLRAVWGSPSLRLLGADAFAGCTELHAFGADPSAGCGPWRRPVLPAGCTRVGPRAFDRTPLADAADGDADESADAPPAASPPPAAAEHAPPAHGFGRGGSGFARLVAEPDRGVLPADVPVRATVRFSLEGAKVPAGDPGSVRTAVNLALVLDRSAAMRGEPFRRECDAALGVLELLGLDGRDAITVVAAGRRAEVLASGLPATEKNRAALAAKIRALEPDDAPAAALFAGVAAGAAGLRAAPAAATAAGARVAKLVVVHGAPPGDGPAAPDDWRRLGASFGKEGFAVVAVGVAPDPSEKRLRALAEGAGGISFASFHAVTGAGVPAIVAGAVDDSFRTVGTDAKLSVRFRGGAVPAGADGRVSVSGDVLEAALGPVVAGCGTTVAVRVEFPPGVPGETLDFAVAEAVWTLPDGTTGSASVPCSVRFGSGP